APCRAPRRRAPSRRARLRTPRGCLLPSRSLASLVLERATQSASRAGLAHPRLHVTWRFEVLRFGIVRGHPALPEPGEILAGKYEILRLVGKGGMGAVFEARHRRLKQRFAIKMLKPELLAVPDCVARFDREGRAAARMTCPNVARIFDVDHTPTGIPYMVIEF